MAREIVAGIIRVCRLLEKGHGYVEDLGVWVVRAFITDAEAAIVAGGSGTNPVDTVLLPSRGKRERRRRRRSLCGKEDKNRKRQNGTLITNDGDARKLDQRALLVMEPDNVAYVRNWHGATGGPAGVGAVVWMGTYEYMRTTNSR